MAIALTTQRPVLEIDTLIDQTNAASLTIYRGEFVLARCTTPTMMMRVVRLIAGLDPATTGHVRFMGEDWSTVRPETAGRLRGHLGLARRRPVWIDYMSLLQNLMLASLHHEQQSREVIADQAAMLCRRMQLPGAPLARPEQVGADELARAAIARAFMGDRRLVVLEAPDRSLLAPVVNLCRDLCRQGGAVLWLTTDRGFFSRPPFHARRVFLSQTSRETVS
ncbi:hypothetical protein HED60_06895 [Planctomycetales bacterium ZRK34]|nr:hypothetical protein HED60_06895 [Planctomycetales bacterium ZRK34]